MKKTDGFTNLFRQTYTQLYLTPGETAKTLRHIMENGYLDGDIEQLTTQDVDGLDVAEIFVQSYENILASYQRDTVHNWGEISCRTGATCSRCGSWFPNYLAHKFEPPEYGCKGENHENYDNQRS